MIYSGDTVRLKCHFKSLNGQSVDPTNPTLTTYDTDQTQIEQINLDDTNKEDVGVYFVDYQVPDDKQKIIFEFRGEHNSNPIVVRDSLEIKFN
ncbi:hypothetical protein [Lentibacillus amyloliquefaciens]|uniref:Ig-like domain-containing protein n=1 Tax=Lentibacillus amyloliquefaciens TaxID=1472767 RepID=A0A0U4FGS7_9BACI|nr:hypothetical protein [Lentibacillus amyloliquefaciens]ALX47854.1 hypothetical protein AOX59_04095 [Lentibacillus amyloliquefaciens]